MYGGTCSVIWLEYLRHHRQLNWKRLMQWAWLAPVLMGGLIEIVQGTCTETRSGEFLDFIADAIGCTLAIGVGLLMKNVKMRKL
jgi:VanZ family protein